MATVFEGLIWQLVAVKGASAIHRFDEPSPSAWPANAFCVMTREAGVKEAVLTDCLWNAEQRLFVSGRLKNTLEAAGVTEVDYLPLKVLDRTGKVLDPAYFFIHCRNAPDCLDLEASGAKRSRAIPSKAESLQQLVFKSNPARALFRPSTYHKVMLVSWPLAETLADAGFSGMRFMGLFDFGFKADLPPNPHRSRVDALCKRLSR